jgi:hypothetical protein
MTETIYVDDDSPRKRLRRDDVSWFQLEAYKPVAGYTLAQWASALYFRYILRGLLEGPATPDDGMVKMLAAMLTRPLGNHHAGPLTAKGLSRVWDLTVIDVYELRDAFRDDMKDAEAACAEWYRRCGEEPEFPPLPKLLDKGFDELLTDKGYEAIREQRVFVDLEATDEQLISDFREWLRNKRIQKRMVVPKRFSEQDASEWHKYKVLLFIDLDMFCYVTHSKISHSTLGALLFPDEYEVDLGERVRKVVRPLVNQIMSGRGRCRTFSDYRTEATLK